MARDWEDEGGTRDPSLMGIFCLWQWKGLENRHHAYSSAAMRMNLMSLKMVRIVDFVSLDIVSTLKS